VSFVVGDFVGGVMVGAGVGDGEGAVGVCV
jgi:hypothetical protein